MLAYIVTSGESASDVEKLIADSIGFQGSILFGSLAKYVAVSSNAQQAKDIDPIFIAEYDNIASGRGPSNVHPKVSTEWTPPSPLAGIVDFLGRLADPHTWVRVGEFTIGAILLAVGANAMLKQELGSNAPQIRAPRTGFTYAKPRPSTKMAGFK